MKILNHSYAIGGNIKRHSCYERQHGVFSKTEKKKKKLPYDPEIPFMGLYPKELKSEFLRAVSTLRFIAVLFTITKIWK